MKTAPSKRGPTSNKYALELHGKPCGWLTDVSGALAVGELGGEGRPDRYEELTLRCWPGMPHEFYAWVAASMTSRPTPARGEVILADDGNAEMSRLSFVGGVITELALASYEYGFRDSLKLNLKFSPHSSKRSYAGGHLGGEVIEARRPLPATDPELHIDGLEEACSQVRRIEGLTIRQRIERPPGDDGIYTVRRVAPAVVGRLALVLAENKALGFTRWLEAVEAGRSNGRAATLTLGAPAVGFTVVLQQVRPARIVEEPGEVGDSRRRELRVELDARGVEFAFAPVREAVV
ncbi:hypothetical protein [Nannocystis punicea]|uniref:Phage tail protein n=1 Tax=Nannocystis punicea TaxID=2995304 RepID=A0ABY7H9Y4_9BACT|nr:hypothetical protein [Nannocystis poenicansa]WAS96088.1 hypothetical protein O0S08_07980 [Nannocystis poenicansa]